MKKNHLIVLCGATFSLFTPYQVCSQHLLEIPEGNFCVPHRVTSRASLYYDHETRQFHVKTDKEERKVSPWNVSGLPKDVSEDQLRAFLRVGYFFLGQRGEEFSLEACVRVRGGMRIGEAVGGEKGREVGRIIGGVAGAAAGGAVGFVAGGAIGGPVGAFVGAGIGAATAYAGEAAGHSGSQGPHNPPAPTQSGPSLGGARPIGPTPISSGVRPIGPTPVGSPGIHPIGPVPAPTRPGGSQSRR